MLWEKKHISPYKQLFPRFYFVFTWGGTARRVHRKSEYLCQTGVKIPQFSYAAPTLTVDFL